MCFALMCTHHQIFKRKSCVCYMQTKLCYHVGGCVCVLGECRFQLLSGRSPYYAWIYNSQFIFDTHELVRKTTSIQNNAINMEFFFLVQSCTFILVGLHLKCILYNVQCLLYISYSVWYYLRCHHGYHRMASTVFYGRALYQYTPIC